MLILFFRLMLIFGGWNGTKLHSFFSFYCSQFTIDNYNKTKTKMSKGVKSTFLKYFSNVRQIVSAFFYGWVSLAVIQTPSQGSQGLRPMHVNNEEEDGMGSTRAG